MKKALAATVAATALLVSGVVHAQSPNTGNLEKLSAFKVTTGNLNIPEVPQTGRRADQIKKNLQQIKMPAGFKIGLYAVVPDARHMAVGRQTGILFVGTRKTKVYTVIDQDKDRVADVVKEFAPTIDMKVPNGVCMSDDNFLFVVEHNRVLVFPAAEFFQEGPDTAAFMVVKQGELIPTEEESFNHGARTCRIGPDNKLYITLGQPFNVPSKEKWEIYSKIGIGGIIRMDRDGKNREVYATGVRNSVGLEFNPKDKTLWFTDNQVDGMGDDIPPGEINRATGPGMNFGFPYYGGGSTRTDEWKAEPLPANLTAPQVEMVAHAADLGLKFYTGTMFPAKYRGGLFSAQRGSWNRTTPVGARIMFTSIKADGTADKTEPFAEGWLTATGEYLGRIVDVAQLPDGSILASDDTAGAIYRIWYEGPR
jgi:glucose/arabinose dehydrogenase